MRCLQLPERVPVMKTNGTTQKTGVFFWLKRGCASSGKKALCEEGPPHFGAAELAYVGAMPHQAAENRAIVFVTLFSDGRFTHSSMP